jgi:hypothetical protein
MNEIDPKIGVATLLSVIEIAFRTILGFYPLILLLKEVSHKVSHLIHLSLHRKVPFSGKIFKGFGPICSWGGLKKL